MLEIASLVHFKKDLIIVATPFDSFSDEQYKDRDELAHNTEEVFPVIEVNEL